jgi:glc operon protein GlcG
MRGTTIIQIMDPKAISELVGKLIAAVEKRLPEYLAIEEDRSRNEGNSALCIIGESGAVYGKMFGTDKIRMRRVFHIAWTKASQVWITGIKTGEYEKLVFTGQIDDKKFGILRPDFIGWEGGQPITVEGSIKLSVGFSGFRGVTDLEIVQKALVDVLAGK